METLTKLGEAQAALEEVAGYGLGDQDDGVDADEVRR